jgi:hypothetical protein
MGSAESCRDRSPVTVLDVSESYPPSEQATWRAAPATAGPSDTSPFQLPPEFYDPEPGGAGPTPPDRRNRLLLQGLGLVGVAVLSGLVFWAVQPSHVTGVAQPAADQRTVTGGKYTYTRVAGPATDQDCAQHAFGQTQQFLQKNPCQQLTRSLYSTTLPNGTVAVVSVVDVKMPSADVAEQLHQLTSSDNTGNIEDLIKDGGVAMPNLPTTKELQDGGFAATANGDVTTIALSAFVGGHQDKVALKQISTDALQLAGK